MEQQLIQAFVDFLSAIIPILVAIVLTWITKQAAGLFERLRERNPDLAYQLEQAAKFGVDFAEQLDLKGRVEDYAHTKKDAAMDAAKEWMTAQGYGNTDLTKFSDALDKAIEVILFRDADEYPHKEK